MAERDKASFEEAREYFIKKASRGQCNIYEEIALKALDKMSKLKPIRANRVIKKNGMFILNEDNAYWKCPVCTKVDVVLLENQEHCDCCGQAIDWEGA